MCTPVCTLITMQIEIESISIPPESTWCSFPSQRLALSTGQWLSSTHSHRWPRLLLALTEMGQVLGALVRSRFLAAGLSLSQAVRQELFLSLHYTQLYAHMIIYPSVHRHLGCFQFWLLLIKLQETFLYKYFYVHTYTLTSSEYIPESKTARPHVGLT